MAPRLVRVLLPIALLGVFPVAGASSHHDPDHFYNCEPSGGELLKTRHALVYWEGGRVDRMELVGCHRPTRMQTILADPAREGRLVFFSPVALSSFRSSVAYAVRERGRTVVEVRDLADSTTDYPPCGEPCGEEAPVLRRLPAAYHPRREVGVETLAVGRHQALAWTTCRLGPGTWYGYDECPRSYGALVRVWRAREGTSKIDLLDQGRKMYPRSLRIDDDRIYWRNGDRIRSAKL